VPPARILFWGVTAGGIVLTIRSVVIGPPSLGAAIAAIAAYTFVVLAGVFVLRLRMFTDAVVRGPAAARGVVLTFDDGPDPVHTREVLDLLDARGVKATFFVIGKKVDEHPEVVQEIVRRGHELGVHGWAHDRFLTLRSAKRIRADLARAIASIETITKKRPRLFRPPIGHTTPTIARIVDDLDLTVIGWTVAAGDGVALRKPADVARRIAKGLEDGAIVMLHDAAERGDRKPAAPRALPAIFDAIEAKNQAVVQLSEWVDEEDADGSSTTKRAPSV
jgi:peptidoglycan/xylan/chitin deacetylase (PgdA/CDA1 family)